MTATLPMEPTVHRAAHEQTGRCPNGGLVTALVVTCMLLFLNEANAQCSAHDILRTGPALDESTAVAKPPAEIRSAAGVPVWKTVKFGAFKNTTAVLNALDAADCSIGDAAQELFGRPSFSLSAGPGDVDLVAVSVSQLGLRSETAPLAAIYARAEQLGFGLAAAEIAPLLRLHYFDQPIGEFLNVAMPPITSWEGEPGIFVVANGGAGLLLLAQDGSPAAQFHAASRFVFVRHATVAAVRNK
jgi:hypothetical protein